MPQVHADPDVLENFARQLRQYSGEVEGLTRTVKGQYESAKQTWQDQEQQKFEDVFIALEQNIKRFCGVVEETAPVLLRKAEALRNYQGG